MKNSTAGRKTAGSTRHKRKPISTWVACVALFAGVVILLYPYVRQMIYQRQAIQLNQDFEVRMETAYTPQEKDTLYQKILAYNINLFAQGQRSLTDSFSVEQADQNLRAYGYDEDMIGYIRIPKMNVELPLYSGATRENLRRGAAHLSQTSLPVGGINSNAVIAGHRGFDSAAMFKDIDKLELGDKVYLVNFRETLVYQVVDTAIILPTEIDKILIQPGRDLVTLFACHPYGFNSHRYVVYTERVPTA